MKIEFIEKLCEEISSYGHTLQIITRKYIVSFGKWQILKALALGIVFITVSGCENLFKPALNSEINQSLNRVNIASFEIASRDFKSSVSVEVNLDAFNAFAKLICKQHEMATSNLMHYGTYSSKGDKKYGILLNLIKTRFPDLDDCLQYSVSKLVSAAGENQNTDQTVKGIYSLLSDALLREAYIYSHCLSENYKSKIRDYTSIFWIVDAIRVIESGRDKSRVTAKKRKFNELEQQRNYLDAKYHYINEGLESLGSIRDLNKNCYIFNPLSELNKVIRNSLIEIDRSVDFSEVLDMYELESARSLPPSFKDRYDEVIPLIKEIEGDFKKKLNALVSNSKALAEGGAGIDYELMIARPLNELNDLLSSEIYNLLTISNVHSRLNFTHLEEIVKRSNQNGQLALPLITIEQRKKLAVENKVENLCLVFKVNALRDILVDHLSKGNISTSKSPSMMLHSIDNLKNRIESKNCGVAREPHTCPERAPGSQEYYREAVYSILKGAETDLSDLESRASSFSGSVWNLRRNQLLLILFEASAFNHTSYSATKSCNSA